MTVAALDAAIAADPARGLRHRRERRLHGRGPPVPARHRHLRRLPRRAVGSGGPPPPLPVHELHELRAARHDHRGAALRPGADDDAGVPALPGVRGRVPGPLEPPLPRRARGLPGLRAEARVAGHRCARRHRDRRGGARRRRRRPARRRDRRDQGPGRLPPRLRRHGRGGRQPAAGPQAPLGQAVRRDGAGRGRRGGDVPRRARWSGRSSSGRRARSCCCGRGAGACRASPSPSRPATGAWASSCPTRRSTTCCSRPWGVRWC